MGILENFIKRGFTPLACSRYAGIAWMGETLKNFWMWNRAYNCAEGGRQIQTVKVTDLKEAALRCWRDGWIPLVKPDDALLRRMEDALRSHKGLKSQGVVFPDGPFMTMPEGLPEVALHKELKGRMKSN